MRREIEFQGQRLELSYRCPRCQGAGIILRPDGRPLGDCDFCGGTGEVTGDRAADYPHNL